MHRIRMSRILQWMIVCSLTILAALFALVTGSLTAQAHAAYKSSTPAANSVLKTAPTSVSITFVQKLDPQGLNITVYGNKGEVVSIGQAQISASDPYTATVAMKGDDSDIYRVDWNNVSAEDGDPTLGAFVFAVDASGTSDKVTPTQSATVASTGSDVSIWIAILAGVGGLVVGGAATFFGQRARTTK